MSFISPFTLVCVKNKIAVHCMCCGRIVTGYQYLAYVGNNTVRLLSMCIGKPCNGSNDLTVSIAFYYSISNVLAYRLYLPHNPINIHYFHTCVLTKFRDKIKLHYVSDVQGFLPSNHCSSLETMKLDPFL